MALAADWSMWGGTTERNMVNMAEKNLPSEWDVKAGKNVRWVADAGSTVYGNPVVAGGRVFVGTNNEKPRDPKTVGDKGVLMCFRESDGKFLWQSVHDKLASGRANDWPDVGICSSPAVDEKRVYFVSNRCELLCLDVETGSLVWRLDMMKELGVFPHNMSTSSPLVVGNRVFALTSNGVDEDHKRPPSPKAPSFISVDKRTGKLLWAKDYPGEKIFHGQWGSPAHGVVNGKPQVYFPGGDGWLYALNPEDGSIIWKFNCNPAGATYLDGGRGTANELVATPVFHANRVFMGTGQDPEHGEGPGNLHCIDATQSGDVTSTARRWQIAGKNFGRTISSVAVYDGLVFVSELKGLLHCIDAETGKEYWNHDMLAIVWGSPMVVDGKVYLGDEDGDVRIFAAAKSKKLIGDINMGSSVYSTPIAANGALIIATKTQVISIAAPAR